MCLHILVGEKSDLGFVCFTTGSIKAAGKGLCQWDMRYERRRARKMNGQFVNIISTMSPHKTSPYTGILWWWAEKKDQLIIRQHHKLVSIRV